MDIPDLVRERLGDEDITAGVSLGDEDAVCLTPTRTLVYSGEGILSDEGIDEFSHDVERLSLKEGRRKTKFALEYVEGTETFTVPSDRGERVLELLLEGVLRYEDVIDRRESIAGVYRFTELTLVVTEGRVLKHIGSHVWDDDFENYPFESVTGLDFERASTATSITIEVDGRPQRVKVPNDTARIVRQTLENALFAYYEVDSLEEFLTTVGDVDPKSDAAPGASEPGDDMEFDAGFDPLVSESEDADESAERGRSGEGGAVPDRMDVSLGSESDGRKKQSGGATDARAPTDAGAADASDPSGSGDRTGEATGADDASTAGTDASDTDTQGDEWGVAPGEASTEREGTTDPSAADRVGPSGADAPGSGRGDARPGDAEHSGSETGSRHSGGTDSTADTADAANPARAPDPTPAMEDESASREDLEAVASQVEDLTEAVERQNELLKRQHKAIKQLVSELRSE